MTSEIGDMATLATWNECPAPAGSAATDHRLVPAVFEPRRSTLVAWAVRMAQLVDRMAQQAGSISVSPTEAGGALVRRTLEGLDRCCRLLPRSDQILAAERARLQIGQKIARRPARYAAYLKLWRRTADKPVELSVDSSQPLHLNPACCWLTYQGRPDSSRKDAVRTSALFFLVNSDLRAVHMTLEGQVLVNALADYQPVTVSQWAQVAAIASAEELIGLARQFARDGLVAIG